MRAVLSEKDDRSCRGLQSRYMAFDVAPGVLFAPWTRRTEHAVSSAPRTSKLGL